MSVAARRIVNETPSPLLTDVALAKTAVLESFYGVPRAALVNSLVNLLRKQNLETLCVDKGVAVQALLCRPSKRASFADARRSFDERFPGAGIEPRRLSGPQKPFTTFWRKAGHKNPPFACVPAERG